MAYASLESFSFVLFLFRIKMGIISTVGPRLLACFMLLMNLEYVGLLLRRILMVFILTTNGCLEIGCCIMMGTD